MLGAQPLKKRPRWLRKKWCLRITWLAGRMRLRTRLWSWPPRPRPPVPSDIRFNFSCPLCGSVLEAVASHAETPGRCPTCAAVFNIPQVDMRTGLATRAAAGESELQDPTPVHAYAAAGEKAGVARSASAPTRGSFASSMVDLSCREHSTGGRMAGNRSGAIESPPADFRCPRDLSTGSRLQDPHDREVGLGRPAPECVQAHGSRFISTRTLLYS